MNVRSERMSVSARFSDTAQLGRLCKKSVRSSGRGVQGGSLSKKLSLNCLYTCVIFYRISAGLKIPGFRPRNGCFPGGIRPGPGGGPARSLHPSPGGRFSALRGLPAALEGAVLGGCGQGGNALYPLTRFRPLPVLLSSPTGWCGGALQTVFSPFWRFMPWKWARPGNALLWAPEIVQRRRQGRGPAVSRALGGCSGSLVRAPGAGRSGESGESARWPGRVCCAAGPGLWGWLPTTEAGGRCGGE